VIDGFQDDAHVYQVQQLADTLAETGLDVINPHDDRNRPHMQAKLIEWVHKEITETKYILIVVSKALCELYKAYKDYNQAALNTYSDTFGWSVSVPCVALNTCIQRDLTRTQSYQFRFVTLDYDDVDGRFYSHMLTQMVYPSLRCDVLYVLTQVHRQDNTVDMETIRKLIKSFHCRPISDRLQHNDAFNAALSKLAQSVSGIPLSSQDGALEADLTITHLLGAVKK
jgi:hypothetical protein